MLYVFSVETGTMLMFEMNLAVDTVDVLMSEIARSCDIPKDKQVLLVSGGSNLNPDLKVCEYGAGTDTCPIFLFSKSAIESEIPPPASIPSASDVSMDEHVESCSKMPATYQTVVIRTQLAQQFAELATNELRVCEKLVHDQRMQQQGWATVIANLQDATHNCHKGANDTRHTVLHYLDSRPSYKDMLLDIHGVIDLLSTIPVLPSLLLKNDLEAQKEHPKQTLLDWLTLSQPKCYIEDYASQCLGLLDKFSAETWSQLEEDVEKVLDAAQDSKMKEVKGLEDRLYALDKLMCEAKKCERDQMQLAQNLLNHQVQVNNLQDTSVLPDLCMTHQHQLILMLKNHQNLRGIRERCVRAKFELCGNLHTRLKWILTVENRIFDINNKLRLYKEYLETLRRHFHTIQEIQSAPVKYLKAVVEVCRRRNFSNNFLKWSCGLSEQSHELYKNEVTLREKFNVEFSNSFMKSLFPGMEDFPPPFATERPEPFDLLLPKIVPEDLDRLRQCLPGMGEILEVPHTEQMPHICLTSDSAFSSEIPSSRAGLPSFSGSLGAQALKTEVQECGSVGDYDCALNEFISLTSSPFEDTIVPTSVSEETPSKLGKSPPLKKKHDDTEVDCKRLHLADCVLEKEIFSPIEEEQQNDSDAEEFEQVDEIPKSDQYETSCPVTMLSEACDIQKECSPSKTVTAASDITADILLPRAASGCRMTSPLEERLRSPDSMLMSQDFQPTDYFIDDSMPSSYTESNGTSALIRGNQMVKSHHVIIAELQNQIEERNFALSRAQGILKMNRTNILKLRRTITALQKYMQELQDGLKYDLITLKEYVMNEKSIALGQISDIMEEVKTAVAGMQSRIHSEKEVAINDAVVREREIMESILQKYQHKLEIEEQKLFDCHTEIDIYQEQIRQHQMILDDLKQESDNKIQEFKKDFCDEKDQLIKGMILEHELELENLRDILKKTVQEKEGEIQELREILSDKDAQVHLLLMDKESLQTEQIERIQKEKDQWTYALEKEYKEKQDVAIKWALEQQLGKHNEELQRVKLEYECHMNKIEEKLRHDFDEEYTQKIQKEKSAGCQVEDFMDVVSQETSLQKMSESEGDKNAMECSQEDSLEAERKRHEAEIAEQKKTLQKEYEEQVEKLKMHCRALKQVTFNEAINRATKDKDVVIEESRKKISTLEARLSSCISGLEQIAQAIIRIRQKISTDDFYTEEARISMTEKLSGILQRVEEMKIVISTSPIFKFDPNLKISELETMLQKRNEELEKSKTKFMKLSMYESARSSISSDKVSVLSCSVGEIVIVYYDEKHENYLVLQFASGPHFLHSDSLEVLDITIPPTDPKKHWTLAQVVDKEYCQAKKACNRYKMPDGAKFYRVKVRRWDREAAFQRHSQRRHSQMGASASSGTVASVLVPADVASGSQMSSSTI